jgi:uncharacterized iron-regulated membrane protein
MYLIFVFKDAEDLLVNGRSPMTSRSIRRWFAVHKWTSLVCTLFLLMLCVTGLPLIFYHEIDHALGKSADLPAMPGHTSRVSVDEIVASARTLHPKSVVQYVAADPDEPYAWSVAMAKTASAEELTAYLTFDARTGKLAQSYPLDEGVMHVLYHLHTDMFAGLPGKLFLGGMGLLLVISLVTGVVLYGPFMRKLRFGTVRYDKANRTRWLDLHNLLGIATAVWLTVVGATGVINTLSDPIFGRWKETELASMTSPFKGKPALTAHGSVERALVSARTASGRTQLSFIAFPGNDFASPHHFVAFMRGDTPLTRRLLTPVLIDGTTSEALETRELPLYTKALLVSQPLHFGDYGGLPLKVLWALLDVLAIIVLGSGVYLWVKKRRIPIDERLGIAFAPDVGAAP